MLFNPVFALWGHWLSPWVLPAVGVAVLALPSGLFLIMWANRRRFNRRNFAGVEEFDGYGHAVGSRLVEGIVRGAGSVLFGTAMFAAILAIAGLVFGRF